MSIEKKYIFRNNKYLEINKPRKLSFKMNIKDLAPEYPEKIINKPKRPKKDNSVKGDIFLNCRCCGVLIRPDWYSHIDKRYCQDCL